MVLKVKPVVADALYRFARKKLNFSCSNKKGWMSSIHNHQYHGHLSWFNLYNYDWKMKVEQKFCPMYAKTFGHRRATDKRTFSGCLNKWDQDSEAFLGSIVDKVKHGFITMILNKNHYQSNGYGEIIAKADHTRAKFLAIIFGMLNVFCLLTVLRIKEHNMCSLRQYSFSAMTICLSIPLSK